MIPVSKPTISKSAKKYVDDCIDSSWIFLQGEYVTKFEERFSGFEKITFSVLTK